MTAQKFIFNLILTIILNFILCRASSNFNCILKDTIQLYDYNFTHLSESDILIVDEQAKEKTTLRLCSPLSQKCKGHNDYSVCVNKDGKEIGMGKFPPVLKNELNTLQFIFTGDQCEANKNYTVVIIMKCDYSVNDTSGLVSFPKSGDPCITHMLWNTDQACIPPAKTNCAVVDQFNNRYDLSPLTATADNHVVYIDEKRGLKLIINVCHSIIHEYGATCYGKVGACLQNSTNSSNIQYHNYGDVFDPLYIEDNTIKIKYRNGDLCPELDTLQASHETTISFICDPEATEYTEPEYLNNSKLCDTKLLWKTSAVCNETFLKQHRSANARKCTVLDPESKFKYNLQTLMNKDFTVNSNNGVEYKFRVCGPLVDSRCALGTGICNTKNSSSGGIANADLMWQHGGPYLNYTDGATCENGQKRHTLIAFVCGAEGSTNLPIIIKDEPCILIIHWYTDLACENRKTCATAKNETNLFPLIRNSKNYIVKAASTEFHINICRPIAPTPNLACPHGSSICQVIKNSKDQYTNAISLGLPDENPVLLDNQNVRLSYHLGSPCPDYPEKNISSSIEFLCDYNGDVGYPEYKNYSNCHYSFEWTTNIVCGAVVGDWVPPCTIKDSSHSHELNLSLLYQKPIPRLVTSKEKNYSISICGGKEHCNGSAVCQGTNGYGTLTKVIFDYRSNVIRLQYSNGTKCSTKSYASELSLICNTTVGIGEPVLILDANCGALFEWHTSVTCSGGRSTTVSDLLSTTTEKTSSIESLNTYNSTQSWIVISMLLLLAMVIGIWIFLRNPQTCVHLRSRINAVTSSRNHSRVQYSRVNTTEEAHLLLDTSDLCTDGQIDSDDELLGV